MQPRRSIVDEFNRRVTLVIALVAIVVVGLNYEISLREARAQAEGRADEVIAAFTEAFRLPFWDHNLSNAMEIATAFSANEWVAFVRVYDALDRPVAGVGMRSDATVFREGDINYGERRVGRVAIGLTLHPLERQNRTVLRNSLTMLLVVVVALYLSNRLILRHGLQRPMRLLLDRIDRIAHGQHDAPAADLKHHEIATLVGQFDAMACKVEQRERSLLDANRELQAAQAELTRHGEQLEQTVVERTRELRDEIVVRRRTEEQLREANRIADAASRAKSDFVAQMSHELRTPLNGVLGCAQILRNDPALSALQLESVETLRQCAEHLLGLINEILDMAKIEAGRMELEPHDFSLVALLQSLERIFRQRAEDKGLGFRLEADAALPGLLHGDERKLRQVLINLLGNAVKFTAAGSVALRIHRADERLRFEVRDTGPGIPPERRDTLFEPFTQFHEGGKRHEGTGLGLAISKRLTQLMGGNLSLRDDEPGGCSFVFELALPEAEPAAAQAHARLQAEQAVCGYRGSPRRLLIADDLALDRKVVSRLLTPLGFVCDEAVDGEDCLIQVERARPDAVLMDVSMPGLDGLATTQRLHAGATAQLPVIAMSSGVRDDEREACRRAGCVGFVPKPVQLPVLLRALESCLQLEWIRRDAAAETKAADHAALDASLLSSAQAQALLEAARKGYLRGILSAVDVLEPAGGSLATLAARIRELARQFRFDEIATLVRG